MNKHVVITGATGFVGSSLVRELVQRGHQVTALVRPGSDRDVLADTAVSWVEGDVQQSGTLQGVFNGADWVIHAAGRLGQAGVSEADYLALHADGTRHVLAEIATLEKRPRVLYVSSPGVLGPIVGPAAPETAPRRPSNSYERSKAEAEAVALDFAEQGIPVIIARPEFIYGPNDLHVLGLFRAVQKGQFFYIGNGRFDCHPTYIDDAVQGMLLCLEKGEPGEIYHITGPEPVTFYELGRTIAAALGVRPPWIRLPRALAWLGAWLLEKIGGIIGFSPPLSRTGVAFFSEHRRFSWQKAHLALGYTPKADLMTGVQQTVNWYKDKGLLG